MSSWIFAIAFVVIVVTSSCTDKKALVDATFSRRAEDNIRTSAVNVVSMGRDDDDGKAKRFHIGGGWAD